jgi:hypothetical protein
MSSDIDTACEMIRLLMLTGARRDEALNVRWDKLPYLSGSSPCAMQSRLPVD